MKTTKANLRRMIRKVLLEARAERDLIWKTPSGGEIRVAEFEGEGEIIQGEWNPTWYYDLDLQWDDGFIDRKRGVGSIEHYIKEFWKELEGTEIEFHNDDLFVVDTQEYIKPEIIGG